MKTFISPIATLIILSLTALSAQAQHTLLMQNGQDLSINGCVHPTGTIYDDGGPSGNYCNSFNGTVTISVPSGITITLQGTYATESHYDWISVFDGNGTTGTTLVSQVSGTGTIQTSSTTGFLTVQFHTDGSVVQTGLALNYSCSGAGLICANAPSALTVTGITTTAAQASWTAPNSSGPFMVNLNGSVTTVSTNSLSLTGLNVNTHYDLSVSSVADNWQPCCTAHRGFRTACGTMDPPLVENFDDYGIGYNILPTCWTKLLNYDDTLNEPQIVGNPFSSSPGSLRMYCGSNNDANHYSMVIGPRMNVTSMATLSLRLTIRAAYTGTHLIVGVCDSTLRTNNNFTPVDTITINNANTWETKLVDLSSYSGSGKYLALRMQRSLQSGNGRYIFVEDVALLPCGTWNERLYDRNYNSMWLSFDTIGSPIVDLEYGPEGFADGTGITVTSISSPYRLTDLAPQTRYEVRLRSTCGSVTDTRTLSLSTLEPPQNELNLCQDFDNITSLPQGWVVAEQYDNTPRLYGSTFYSPGNSLQMRGYYYDRHSMIALPPIDTVTLQSLSVNFAMNGNGQLIIGVMDYPEQVSSFVPVDTIQGTNNWKHYSISLERYRGNGKYIAFWCWYEYCYLDNIEVTQCALGDVSITDVTNRSVHIVWDTVGSDWPGSDVTIEYGGEGFPLGSGTRISANASQGGITITGLTADSTYDFVIYGNCDTLVQNCGMNRRTVHTLQRQLTPSYCEDFEAYPSGGYPYSWYRPLMYSSRPRVNNNRTHSGLMALNFYSYNANGNQTMAVLPLIEVDTPTTLFVSFWYNGSGTGSQTDNYMELGLLNSPDEPASFTSVGLYPLASGLWQRATAQIVDYTGTGQYLALRLYSYYGYECWVDDISITTCQVTNVTVTGLTDHSAHISWVLNGAGDGSTLEYGPRGFAPGSGTRVQVSGNNYTIDGLGADSLYDFYLWGNCSADSGYCPFECYSFRTLALPTVSTFCENFQSHTNGSLPNGMYRPWVFDNLPRITNEGNPGYCITFRTYKYYTNDSNSTFLVMPLLEESDLTGLMLNFDLRQAYNDNQSHWTVGLMTDPYDTTTFTPIADTNPTTSWQRYNVSLSAYSGPARYIAFHYHYNQPPNGYYNNYAYLDNITIERCGVSGIQAYSATAHDAWLRWDTYGSTASVEVEYALAGSDSTILIANATSPLHLDNLTPGTTYQYIVRANCTGSSQTCDQETYTFSTRTDSIMPGYCEGFDWMGTGELPSFWTRLQTFSYRPQVINNSSPIYSTSPNQSIEFYSCDGLSDGNFLVIPAAENSVANGVVSFNLRCNTTDVQGRVSMTVGVMELPFDSTSFVPMATIYPTYQWKKYSVDLGSYTGTGRHIAFRYKSLNGCHYSYLDDFGFSQCRPANLHATMVTDQSVLLSWNASGATSGATSYTVEYGPEGFTRGQGTFLHTSATSLTVTGLTQSTNYRFYVWASCQDSNQCQEENIAVRTLDELLLPPFCTSFDNVSIGQLPTGWTRCYGDEYPRVSDWRYRSSSRSLSFYSYKCNNWSDRTSMAAMPMLGLDDISQLQVDFYFYDENNNSSLEIGVMTNPYDSNTFTVLHTIQSYNRWTRVKRSLAAYSGSGRYLAFRYKANYCTSGYAYIDDLTLRTCAITNYSLSGLGPEGVDIQWGATSGTEGIWMTYTPGGGSPTFHTTSPIHIAGLASATQFQVRLWPQCDSVYDDCNYELLVEETLHPEIDIPFCSNFDNLATGGFPNNWRRLSTVGSDYPRSVSHTNHSPNNSMQFYATGTLYSLAALPTINSRNSCLATNQLYLNFWTYFSGNTTQGRLVLGVMENILDTNSFVAVDTVIYGTQGWEHHTVPLSAYTGSSHIIAFKFLSANGSWCECYVDDLCVERCVAADVSISDITQNSVTISWTGSGTQGLIIEYGEQGFAHGHGTRDTLTTSPYTLTGLNELTTYEFNFISLCQCDKTGATYPVGGGSGGVAGGGSWGGGGGGWGGGTGFVITTQAHFLEVPYCESFEGFDTLSFAPSWRRIPGSSHLYPAITHANHHNGDYGMALYTTTDTATYMSLPPLPVGTTQEMVMTFFAYATNNYATNTDALHVGVMENPDDPATYTEVAALRLNATGRWQQLSVDFANYVGNGQYITFRFKPIYNSYTYYIDDLYVGRCGVTNVQFATTPSSVQVSWTPLHTPTSVTIQYGRQGFADDSSYTPTTITTTSNSYTIANIDPDSNYDFYISAHCSDTDDALCTPVSYTLNPMLYAPYCMDFEDIPAGALPADWRVLRSRAQYPVSETQFGEQIIAFYPCSDNHNVVMLRPLSSGDSLQGKWVYARFSTEYSNYIFLDFGTLSDTSNAASFVQMGSMAGSANQQIREYNVQLSASGSVGNRFAIRARSTSGCRWIRLSDLVLANFPYPTGLSSNIYGNSSRLITWDNLYGNPYYTIEYGHGNQWQTVSSDSCQVLLTGLESGTSYEVYFISPSGERLCLPYRFDTPDAVPLPYCENFDQYDNLAVPTDWHSHSSYGDSYPRTYNSAYNSCCRTLDFYCDYSHLQYTAMPDFDVDSVCHLDLQFNLRIENVNNTKLIVGVMDDRTDFNTFVPVDTLVNTSNSVYFHKHITLSNYHGTGRYVTFLFSTSSGRTSLFIDDLTVAACPMPDISAAGSSSVALRLPRAAERALVSPDYWVEYGLAGCQPGDAGNVLVHITENPAYIGPLIPDSTYTFYTLCSQEGASCTPVNVAIAHEEALPYCDDFDSYDNGQMPTGWTAIREGGTPEPYVNSNHHLFFGNYCNAANRDYAVMPDLTIDSIRNAELYFDLYSNYWNSQYLIVGVMDDRGDLATFTPIDTLMCTASNVWQPQHVSLHNYEGTGRFIAFCAYRTGGCMYLYLDNLKVGSHPIPSYALADATTVRVSTDCNRPTDYWVEYRPSEDSTSAWVHVTSCDTTIGGLEGLTDYLFFHHADSGDVTCFPPQPIRTAQSVALPYCEDFEHFEVAELSEGWTNFQECNRTDQLAHTPFIGYSWALSKALDLTGYCNQWVVMPSMLLDGEREVQFSCRLGVNGYWNRQYIVVGTLTDRLDPSTFTPYDTIRCTADNVYQWQHVRIDGLDGNVVNIAFHYVNTVGSYSLYMDNIITTPLPEPRVSLVAYNTIQLDIDTSYVARDYWVRITAADNLDTLMHVDTNPYQVTGLDELSQYVVEFYYDSLTPACYPSVNVNTSRLQSLPYCEEFATYGTGSAVFPTGWVRRSNENIDSRAYVASNSSSSDSRVLSTYTYLNRSVITVLPEMDVADLRDVFLRLKMSCSSGHEYMLVEVGVMNDQTDTNTFEVVDTLRNSLSGTWEELTASLSGYGGHGRFLALRVKNLSTSWRYVYIDRLEVLDCDLPEGLRATLNRHNVVRVTADRETSTGFWVEYGTSGFAQGTGTFQRVDTLPFDLTLAGQTIYDFYFYCDTATPTCLPKQTVATLPPPLAVPVCFDFDTCRNNNMPYGWGRMRVPEEYGNDCYVYNDVSHTAQRSLRFCSAYTNRFPYAVLPDLQVDSLSNLAVSFWMRNDNYSTFILELGVMNDPYDPSSFITIKRFQNTQNNTWQQMRAVLKDAPGDAHFVAFRLIKTSGSWSWLYLDDLYISTCGASDLRLDELASDHITLNWNQAGSPNLTVEYGPNGFLAGMGTTLHPSRPPLTIGGLSNLTNYEFRLRAICDFTTTGYCQNNYYDTVTLFTPAGGTGCIDPTNLTASYTTCTYGSYSNPRSSQGLQDYGYESPLSRHTVHYDTTERDPRTGGLLRTIPQGSEASVRLGNWMTNPASPEAESVTYSLFVDPASFDLLILKYAAVLQDPEHSASQQPRFSIEILDEGNNLIDSHCGAADFIANAQLGWNVAAGDVLWKDWTTVGLDMSAYANQTVRIRLTTYDCGEGSHYGYAYFTLGCLLKNILSESCGDVAANTYTMPDGFNYNWYTDTVNKTTIYNTQTVTIPTANTTYYCDLSFVDDASCFFTMSTYVGTRYPLALFDSVVSTSNCQFHVAFNNLSTISSDGVTPIGTGEGCEAAYWDFGNGETSTEYNGSTVYTTPGTYQVMLVSYIGGGTCTDTIIKPLVLEYPSTTPILYGPTERCQNGTPDTLRVTGATSYVWSAMGQDSLLVVAPDSSTRYTCVVTNPDGCVDTLTHFVEVHPTYALVDSLELCAAQLPYLWGDTLLGAESATDTFHFNRTSAYGCDSLHTLRLTIHHASSGDTTAMVCDSLVWYGRSYAETPTALPTHLLSNQHGCDSLLSLHLTVGHSSNLIAYDTVLENDLPYQYGELEFAGDTSVSLVLTNTDGCDSTVIINLHVIWNNRTTVHDTVCDSQLPLTWNHRTFTTAGTQYDTLTNSLGSDSLLTMVLHVLPTYDLHFYDTICSNQSFTFDGSNYNMGGSYTDSLHTLAPLACDSLRTLHLTVFPTTMGDTSATVCDQFVWYGRNYVSSTTDTLFQHYSNAEGCDSTVLLHLTVRHSTTATYHDTCTENQLPRSYLGLTVYGDTAGVILTTANAEGCDSTIAYNLHVIWNNRTTVHDTVCDSQLPLTWNHRTFTTAGTQYDTLTNSFGSDSLLTMVLHVLPTYDLHFYDTICSNQTSTFDGSNYNMGGSYTDSLHTLAPLACDSLRTLHLTVFPTTMGDTSATVCDQFVWYGRNYVSSTTDTLFQHYSNAEGCDSTVLLHLTVRHSTTATYHDTCTENQLPRSYLGLTAYGDTAGVILTTSNVEGCDSTIAYNLHVIWNNRTTVHDTICDSQLPLTWNHRTFTTAGTQYDTLTNSLGSDSLLTMVLHVLPTYDLHFYDTICSNQTSTFDGSNYNMGGSYTDSLHTLAPLACDSIRTLHLTVFPTTMGDTSATACDGYVWYGQSFNVTPALPPTHLTTNAHGCDSTVTLNLTIRYSDLITDFDTICQNSLIGGFSWRDTLLYPGTATGSYLYTRLNQWGCDSTLSLQLQVLMNTFDTVFDTIVQNQASAWQYLGISITQDTANMDVVLVNHWGCDSVVNYNLFIWPNDSTQRDSTICGDAVADFRWQGHGFADTIRHTFLNSHGADSTVTLLMHVNNSYAIDYYDTICQGGYVNFSDSACGTEGEYVHHFLSVASCDSAVTLHLTVHPTYDLHFYDTIYLGQSVQFEGSTFTLPGDYTFRYTTQEGCDSVRTLHIKDITLTEVALVDSICQGDSIFFAGRYLSQPGVYSDTLVGSDPLLGDTLLTLTLYVLPYPTISFDTSYICGSNAHYNLLAHTDALYWQWTSLPYDLAIDDHEGDSLIFPMPVQSTTYYLFADYGDTPLCPSVDSIKLEPIQMVVALIDVKPDYLTYERRELTVRDAASNVGTVRQWHVWYYDGASFADTARMLQMDVPLNVDSVLITLRVASDLCADSDTVMVHSIISNLFFPNVFTPALSENNTFKALGRGIQDFEIWIYDRRGDLVFHSTDIEQAWDGTHEGTPCTQAAYVYKCRYSTTLEPQAYKSVTGTVTLIR